MSRGKRKQAKPKAETGYHLDCCVEFLAHPIWEQKIL
jgi:hypothetical protein